MKKSEIIKLAIKNNFDEAYLSSIKAPLLKRAYNIESKNSTDVNIILKTIIDNLKSNAPVYNAIPKERKRKKVFNAAEAAEYLKTHDQNLIINN